VREVTGQLVDIHQRRIYPARVVIRDGKIEAIEPWDGKGPYLLPGFVDAHIHIESSLCAPTEFARGAIAHGTVATISDPHEIANVMGIEGVRWMVENASHSPLKVAFGAPSCVPATQFETAGDEIDPNGVEQLFDELGLTYLSEMMNFPGVLQGDATVMAKLDLAKARGLPIDGHAPGLRGEEARRYMQAGISTDHECFTLEEGVDKAELGMKILIREGSAARNFEALHPLLQSHPHLVMFCSDDKHPDSLERGHINALVRRSLELSYDLFDVLRAASLHPVEHYKLDVGLLRVGDPADFIVMDELEKMEPHATYIDGELCQPASFPIETINRFATLPKKPSQFQNTPNAPIIGALEGQLITESLPDVSSDKLKIAVVNRYRNAPPATAYIHGFGLERGALASSVAHDSHNIVAVGCSDEELCRAVNAIIEHSGGLAVVDGADIEILPLPVAGLMSDQPIEWVTGKYTALNRRAHTLGTSLRDPFMTLSFMALLVIPSLKLSDLGLFDGETFRFIQS
jgi:adenine deaminase